MDEDGKSLVVLPDELILHILQFLKFREILNLISCLNKKFYELSKDPKLIPKSITLNLFRSSSHENNIRNRCQVADIISRASLLKTLSIEVNNTCNLNDELQQIGNGLCRVKFKLKRYLLLISNNFYSCSFLSMLKCYIFLLGNKNSGNSGVQPKFNG